MWFNAFNESDSNFLCETIWQLYLRQIVSWKLNNSEPEKNRRIRPIFRQQMTKIQSPWRLRQWQGCVMWPSPPPVRMVGVHGISEDSTHFFSRDGWLPNVARCENPKYGSVWKLVIPINIHIYIYIKKLHRHRPQIEKVGTDGSQRGNQRLPWQGTAGSQTLKLRVPNLGTRGCHCKELPVPRSWIYVFEAKQLSL